MKTKASNPAAFLEGKEASPPIRAFFESCHLKNLFRQGWLRRGVPVGRCESVAEHSFSTALLALLLAKAASPGLDMDKVLRMALIHDLGEVHAGDLTPGDVAAGDLTPGDVTAGDPAPGDRPGRDEKLGLERESIGQVLAGLPDAAALAALWEEYAEGRSPEALFVRQIDRLEMALQAAVYELQGMGDLSEFIATARRDISDPAFKGLLEEAASLR